MILLFSSVNRDELFAALSNAKVEWIILSILMFIPQTVAIGYRWTLIAKPLARISLKEAVRQVLASSCLNLVLPSKLGDLAKGVFLYRQKKCGWEEGFQIVVFEKLLDLAALSAIMVCASLVVWPGPVPLQLMVLLGCFVVGVVALVYFTPYGAAVFQGVLPKKKKSGIVGKVLGLVEAGPKVMTLIHGKGSRSTALVGWSLLIWSLHLIQILFFFFALSIPVSAFAVLLKMPMAIFVGLLPLSLAGFGTREWAIVLLFQSETVSVASLIAVGVLFSSRYFFPALAGLLFVQRYYGLSQAAANRPQTTLKAKAK